MYLEVNFSLDGIRIKSIRLHTQRDKSVIEVLELRENKYGESGWVPVYVKVHDKFYAARLELIGLLAEAGYENASNTDDTSRENIFVRGSKPYFRSK